MSESNDNELIETVDGPTFANTKNPNYYSAYCNQTAFASTAFDFSMIFGEIMDIDPQSKNVKIEQKVRVVMSPIHFKIFAGVCAMNIKQYEEKFGEIKLPIEGASVVERA